MTESSTALIARSVETMDYGDPAANSAQYLERAIALRPDSARAHGLFAYARALRADNEASVGPNTALQDSERASRAALALDPDQPDTKPNPKPSLKGRFWTLPPRKTGCERPLPQSPITSA